MYGIEGLLAGRTLVERYRIEEVIGRGGMGAVYRARDERLGREVAVKVIAVAAPDPESHARLRARFHREARAAASLHHPNVVSIYDFGTDRTLDLDFLVMELLRGEDLASRLTRKGPPAPRASLAILCQAARGLAAGHRAGLIHRDVKPGNLFLQAGDSPGDVEARVLDFGIAEVSADEQTLTHLTLYGRSPFSPAYASPEQLRGEVCLTPATDVFSLAAVGYHLLTGERAFTSGDPERMAIELSAALAGMARLPLPRPPVREVLRRALAHAPEHRYPDAGAFAAALAPLLSAAEMEVAQRDAVRWAEPATAQREEARRPRRFLSLFSRAEAKPTRATSMTNGATATRTAFAAPAGTIHAPGPTHAERAAAAPPTLGTATVAPVRARTAPPPMAAPAPRRGWFGRAAAALWNFCVTAVVVGIFVTAWVVALIGLDVGDPAWTLGGVAGSIVLTPLAVHRVMGRRGSYRLALLGSISASLGALFLVGPSGDTEMLLATMFGLQLLTSLLVSRLTRRPAPPAAAAPQTALRA